jgi:hypothetical protein
VTAKPGENDPKYPELRACRWSTSDGATTAGVTCSSSASDAAQFRAQPADATVMPDSRVDVGDGAIDTGIGLEVLVVTPAW